MSNANALHLERYINSLDIEEQRVEAEHLIEACFETGFFPWGSPKFQVFLHAYLLACLSYRPHRFMRGLICARHIAYLMPDTMDADLARDIRSWAGLELTGSLPAISCRWPGAATPRLFWLRFWRRCDRQAYQLLRLRLKTMRNSNLF
jgi:hypothetical protein